MSKKEFRKERFDHEDLLDISSTAQDAPLVDDSDDDVEDGDSEGGILSKILFVLRLPIRGAVLLGGLLGTAGRSLVGALGRLGSFFVLRDAESEDEETNDDTPDFQPVVSAAKSKDKPIASTASEEMFDEDDEDPRFFNLGLGMKLAALAATCLLGVGGYFGVKSLFSKSDPEPTRIVADVPENADVKDAPAPVPAKPEEKKAAKDLAAKDAPPPPKKPEEKKDEKKDEKTVAAAKPAAPAPPKKSEEKKDDKTAAAVKPKSEEKKDAKQLAAKDAPPPPKKPEEKKDGKKKDEKTVAAAKPAPATPAPKVADAKPVDPFLVSDPVPGAPAPPVAETAAAPFWATPLSDTPTPAGGAIDWASPTPSTAAASPTPPSPTPQPPPASSVADASPEAPLIMPLAGPIPTSSSPAPVSTTSPDPPTLNEPKSTASTGTSANSASSGGLVPLQPLTASAAPVPPTSNVPSDFAVNEVPKERPVGIPESGLERFAAEEFRRVPEAPNVEAPVSTLAFDEPIRPLAPAASVPDTVPGIPGSTAVEPLARTSTPSSLQPMQPVHVNESAPAIPGDFRPVEVTPASSIAFSTPVSVAETPAFVPPISSAQPIQPMQPATAVAAVPMQPLGGDRIGIPGDSSPAAPLQPTVAPTQPEHELLARTDPPLGMRLQNEVRELRTQETVDPKLNFERKDAAATGAVRFSPATTSAAPAPLPMPTGDQPSSLELLNPTGTGQDPSMAAMLPSASESPRAIPAESYPGYDRSIRSRTPADASVDTGAASTAPSPNRARLFQQKLDEEIKRSPSDTELYTVQDGDTYMTICDRYFGTSLLYRALAEHNRRRGAAYMPAAGTQIEIPTADYLKTEYAEALSRSGRRGNRVSSGTAPQRGARYRVQEGDSVFRIATNQLRDSSRWREIVELNSDQLRSAKDLQPGMEIYLPAGNAAASTTPTVYGRR